MKITKYVHSCLAVEEKGETVLFDPGNYTAKAREFDVDSFSKIDVLCITHEHQDHMDVGLIKRVAAKFPGIQIIGNQSVVRLLEREGVKASSQEPDFISIEDVPHEKLLSGAPVPQNTLFLCWKKFVHPGDSLHFQKGGEVLALPIQAPWGSFVQAIEKAVLFNPTLVIPVHDWHWRDEARKSLYERARLYLRDHGIGFAALETGQPFEF